MSYRMSGIGPLSQCYRDCRHLARATSSRYSSRCHSSGGPMKASSGKSFALLLLLVAAATVAVAQDMPQAFLLRRFTIAPITYSAPAFASYTFHAADVQGSLPVRTTCTAW